MQSAGLRNKPIDRRYLRSERNRTGSPVNDEREAYDASGDYGARAQALKRTKAYKGQMAYEQNRPIRTVTTRPGTGGQNSGIGIQRQRKVNQAMSNERSADLRPEMDSTPNIYEQLDTRYG